MTSQYNCFLGNQKIEVMGIRSKLIHTFVVVKPEKNLMKSAQYSTDCRWLSKVGHLNPTGIDEGGA